MAVERWLLTGATGFLGTAFTHHLKSQRPEDPLLFLSRRPRPGALIADLENLAALKKIAPELEHVDVFVDMATLMPYRIGSSFLQTNVGGVANILQVFPRPPRRIIYISSTDVYRVSRGTRIDEQTTPAPQSEYAVSKLTAEQLYIQYAQTHHVPLTILRVSSIYGPGDPSGKVINRFVEAAMDGTPLQIYGDGEDLRDFIFIEDAVKMIYETIHRRLDGVFNVVTGKSHRVLDLVPILEKRLGKKFTLEFHERRAPQWDQEFAPSALLKHNVPSPQTTLEQGLIHVLYFKEALRRKV